MKKLILTTSLAAMVAGSVFGQGVLSFKASQTKDPVLFASDGTTASLAYVATDGTAGSLGTVSYILYSAPSGTLSSTITTGNLGTVPTFSSAWSASPIALTNSPIYLQAGAPNSENATTAAASGPAGPTDILILAYTGTSLATATSVGYSGELFNAGATFTFGGFSGTTGALGWQNSTGNPGPPPSPGAILTGNAADGALVLVPNAPEPTTLAIGGLAAAALLAFRRRK